MTLIEDVSRFRPGNQFGSVYAGPVESVAAAAVLLAKDAVDMFQILVLYLLFLHPAWMENGETAR